jgi:hypothetical protein
MSISPGFGNRATWFYRSDKRAPTLQAALHQRLRLRSIVPRTPALHQRLTELNVLVRREAVVGRRQKLDALAGEMEEAERRGDHTAAWRTLYQLNPRGARGAASRRGTTLKTDDGAVIVSVRRQAEALTAHFKVDPNRGDGANAGRVGTLRAGTSAPSAHAALLAPAPAGTDAALGARWARYLAPGALAGLLLGFRSG